MGRAGTGPRLTSDAVAGLLFVAPLLALIVTFIYWPLLYSAYLSLFDWNFVSPDWRFVGATNYTRLPDDPRFRLAIAQTILYVAALVPIKVFLPLGLALLLWPIRRSRAQPVYRVVLFTPTVVSFAVAALVWLWIFNPLQGVLNQAIVGAGGSRVNWLSNPQTAVWCVILVSTWKAFGPYRQAFRYFQTGIASAVAILLSAAVIILTWLQFRFVERHVHYG